MRRFVFLHRIWGRRVAVVMLIVILAASSTMLAYAFTAFWSPAGTCPVLRWGWGPTGKGPMPFNIVSAGANHVAYSGTGLMSWCLYSNAGVLVQSYRTGLVLGGVEAASDGSHVVVSGSAVLPGPAGIWANGKVYLFDNRGRILWNFSSTDGIPIFSATLNHNASVVLAFNPGLFYLDRGGGLIWSGFATAARLVNDGSLVAAAVSDRNGSAIVLYDNQGRVLWRHSINDSSIFDGSNVLAVWSDHIVAGTSFSGYNGTLYYLDFSGNLVWSSHVDSAVLSVDFTENALISVKTNWGTETFDLQGNLIGR